MIWVNTWINYHPLPESCSHILFNWVISIHSHHMSKPSQSTTLHQFSDTVHNQHPLHLLYCSFPLWIVVITVLHSTSQLWWIWQTQEYSTIPYTLCCYHTLLPSITLSKVPTTCLPFTALSLLVYPNAGKYKPFYREPQSLPTLSKPDTFTLSLNVLPTEHKRLNTYPWWLTQLAGTLQRCARPPRGRPWGSQRWQPAPPLHTCRCTPHALLAPAHHPPHPAPPYSAGQKKCSCVIVHSGYQYHTWIHFEDASTSMDGQSSYKTLRKLTTLRNEWASTIKLNNLHHEYLHAIWMHF